MKVEYVMVVSETEQGRMALQIIPETDFEKSFIKSNKWDSFMQGFPLVMTTEEESL